MRQGHRIDSDAARFKVAVIGAGPAGSATVLQLIDRGLAPEQIFWVDRNDFPRQKLCGGGLVSRTWQWLEQWGIREFQSYEPANGIRFVAGDTSQILVEPGKLGAVDRWELDWKLIEVAKARGAVLHKASMSIVAAERGWILQANETGPVYAGYLIGADGFGSSVRRLVAPQAGKGWSGKLFEFSRVSDLQLSDNALEFDFEIVSAGVEGYCWAFPYKTQTGERAVKFGIMDRSGTTPTTRLKELLAEYCARHGIAVPADLEGYPERYFKPGLRLIYPRAALVGDAYGIDPLLGEGIGIAFDQADFVARTCLRHIRRDETLPAYLNYVFHFDRSGWNLWFLYVLGALCYGRFWRHWIGVLTSMAQLRAFSERASPGYGRLAARPIALTWIALTSFLGGNVNRYISYRYKRNIRI